jgi:flagellar biosynthetic protein FliQ
MQEADIAAMIRESMWVILKLGGPVLAVALATGLLVSLVQAATQINEQTLAFVPKVIAVGATLLLSGAFMMGVLNDFTHRIFDQIVAVGGS